MRSITAILVPARLNSKRLPGKMLKKIGGVTVVIRALANTFECQNAYISAVVTDSTEIVGEVISMGHLAYYSPLPFNNGTERVAFFANMPVFSKADIIINVQGDQIEFDPLILDKMVDALQADLTRDAVTLYKRSTRATTRSTVILAMDAKGRLLDLCRSTLSEGTEHLEHIGVYAFRREALEKCVRSPLSAVARERDIEGIRMYEAGLNVHCMEHEGRVLGVNTKDDLDFARRLYEKKENGEDVESKPKKRRTAAQRKAAKGGRKP